MKAWRLTRREGDDMKAFKIDGEIEVEKRCWQKFSKEIAADDEAKAREKLMCDLGSRQGMKRRNINVKSVQEVKKDKVVDHVVRYQLGVD
jgi:large subunit ribosomal protein LX